MAANPWKPPADWPRWNKVCGARRRGTGGASLCKRYATIGNARCKFHGGGGERMLQQGKLRYLAWIITGGPQNVPVQEACDIALSAFFDQLVKQGKGSASQQMKAALWLTQMLE